MKGQGRFITFEGADGCGKTTLAQRLVQALQKKKIPCVLDCEPTTAPIGQVIREHLKDNDLSAQTFLFLFLADRYEHVQSMIRPALKSSQWVILDRYMDSTWAYQSAHCHLDVEALKRWTAQFEWFLIPERTYLLSLSYEQMVARIRGRATLEANDRAGRAFYDDVSQRFATLADLEPQRFVLLDGSQPVETLLDRVLEDLAPWM